MVFIYRERILKRLSMWKRGRVAGVEIRVKNFSQFLGKEEGREKSSVIHTIVEII